MSRFPFLRLTGLAGLFSLGAFSFADSNLSTRDWPSWRGPTANGIAPKEAQPPLKWDDKTNILWKVELPGPGSATPIIIGDQVIVLTATKTEKKQNPRNSPHATNALKQKPIHRIAFIALMS